MKKLSTKTKAFNFIRQVFLFRPFEIILRKIIKSRFGYDFFQKLIPSHYLYPKNSFRQFRHNSINYQGDISFFNEWKIYWDIIQEMKPKEFFYAELKKGDTVIDVGAHLGEISMNAAKVIGSEGQVHSFEPHPITFKKIEKNLSINNFNNILANNMGLGNQNMVAKLYIENENNPGQNRILNESAMFVGKTVEIKVLVLDDYIEEKNISKVDAMKLDVEGFELKVLEGAKNILMKYKPILFIEIDDKLLKLQNSSANELISFLLNIGYTNITKVMTQENINAKHNLVNCHFDILCK